MNASPRSSLMNVAVLATAMALAACGSRPARAPEKATGRDLMPGLARAVQAAGKPSGQPRMEVTRGGRRMQCAVLIAPVLVGVPVGWDAKGRYTLELVAAPVFNIGDGIDVEVLLHGSAGARRLLARRFDPARRADDRAWQKIAVPMDLTGTPGEAIQFRVTGGPEGDLVDDWLALGSVTLARGAPAP